MQRHFSNRGEALAETTAARMLAHRKQLALKQSSAKAGRTPKTAEWFAKPGEVMPPRKK